tara:strand:+ start:2143 stop:2877 length:735 start_codon:yes stop_codon:yes gene_type:complete
VEKSWYEILPIFLIALAVWLCLYEIGYLENDAITIKKETKPTLRIPDNEIQYIQQNFTKLVVARIVISAIGIAAMALISNFIGIHIHILLFLGFLILARIAFTLHNTLRSRWNIVTYLLLSTTKYLSLPLLFLNFMDHWYVVLIIYFSFPLPRTIEHAAKIKYGINWLQKIVVNLDFFRFCYYSFLMLIVLIIQYQSRNSILAVPTYIAFWFFAFRTGSFVLIKLGGYKRTKTSSHKWDNQVNK